MKISLIVLSKTDSDAIYNMNRICFSSFKVSAIKAKVDFEMLLIESDLNENYSYVNVKKISPKDNFNFHKFLNIGIENATGEVYVLSNNDVIFDKNWLFEILEVSKENPEILSFSPYDEYSNKLNFQTIRDNKYIKGYEIQKHLTGWCIVVDRRVFKTLKYLDEIFDFYYADFDYAMSLQKYNIKHALVTRAYVKHIEYRTQDTNIPFDERTKDKRMPDYLLKENWTWVLQNPKMIDGIIKYHQKWGSRKSIKIRLFIINQLNKLGLGYFNRFIL